MVVDSKNIKGVLSPLKLTALKLDRYSNMMFVLHTRPRVAIVQK